MPLLGPWPVGGEEAKESFRPDRPDGHKTGGEGQETPHTHLGGGGGEVTVPGRRQDGDIFLETDGSRELVDVRALAPPTFRDPVGVRV